MRYAILAYWTDISVVLTVLEKSVCTRDNRKYDVTLLAITSLWLFPSQW